MKKSLNVVFLADTHLGFDYPLRPRTDRPRRGEDFFRNFRTILNYAREQRADLLLHGGDLFFRSKVHKSIVDRTYRMLSDVAQAGIPVVIVPGNHERSVLPGSLFLNHRHIYVFDKPRTFSFKKNGLSVALAGFPSVRDKIRSAFGKHLEATGYREIGADFRMLCLHQAVDGATVGPANFTFRNRPDTIAAQDLPTDIDLVCSGHIHRQQLLAAASIGKPPVLYPGSIERTSFAERAEDKGFVHICLSKGQSPQIRFIPLPTRPMVDVLLDAANSSSDLDRKLKQNLERLPTNSIVRLGIKKAKPGTPLPQLTTARIRKWAAPQMIIQLSRRMFQPPLPRASKEDLSLRIQKEVRDVPGIYRYYRNGQCIYVGKSIHLRQRMLSYFRKNDRIPDERIRTMVHGIDDFDVYETGSEFMALLTEDALIKREHPEFNVQQQEHGEYHWLKLSNDPYPALHIVAHARRNGSGGEYFGPFKDRYRAEEMKRLLARHLHIRQCTDTTPFRKSINFELGICAAPCRGQIDTSQYGAITIMVRDYLQGNSASLLHRIELAMQAAAQALHFEEAAELKKDLDFFRAFARRQRFAGRLKKGRLQVLDGNDWYRFEYGELVRAKVGGKLVLKKNLNACQLDLTDARFLFDRATIVYRWLQEDRHSGFWY